MYNGELTKKNVFSEEVNNWRGRLGQLSAVNEEIETDKLELGNAIFNAYRAYYKFQVEARGNEFNEEDISTFEDLKNEFESQVEDQKSEIEGKIQETNQMIIQFIENANDIQTSLKLKIQISDNLVAIIQDLKSFSNSQYEFVNKMLDPEIYQQDLSDLANLADDATMQVSASAFDEVRVGLSELANLVSEGYNVDMDNLLQMVSASEKESFTTFKSSFDKLANVFAQIPKTLSRENRTNELAKFVIDKNLMDSQLDRLQDFGHVHWKEIARNLDSAEYWSRKFTSTEFSAQGNSSIILVRDSPINFRPQQINNDPSALIQSQLQISRATTGLALSIAGAIGGIDINQSPAANIPAEEVTNTNIGNRAAIERRIELREKSLSNLISNLENIESDLIEKGDDATDRAKILSRLEVITNAYLLKLK